MDKITKKEIKEIEVKLTEIVSELKHKLNLNVVVHVDCMKPTNYLKKHKENLLTLQRTNRGTEDKDSFSLEFNPYKMRNKKITECKKDIFHEMMHVVTWPFIDEQAEALKHIKHGPLHKELQKRMSDVSEQVVYNLERRLGPFVLTECDWTKDT